MLALSAMAPVADQVVPALQSSEVAAQAALPFQKMQVGIFGMNFCIGWCYYGDCCETEGVL